MGGGSEIGGAAGAGVGSVMGAGIGSGIGVVVGSGCGMGTGSDVGVVWATNGLFIEFSFSNDIKSSRQKSCIRGQLNTCRTAPLACMFG